MVLDVLRLSKIEWRVSEAALDADEWRTKTKKVASLMRVATIVFVMPPFFN